MRDALMWRRPAAATTLLGGRAWEQEHGFLSLPGGRVYGLWRLDDRLGVHILIGSGWAQYHGATPGSEIGSGGLLRQMEHGLVSN